MEIAQMEVDNPPPHRAVNGSQEEENKDLERDIRRLKGKLDHELKKRELEKELLILGVREDEQLKLQITALRHQLETKDQAIDLLKDKLHQSDELLAGHDKTVDELTSESQAWRNKFYDQEQRTEDLEARGVELESDLNDKKSQLEIEMTRNRGGSGEDEYRKKLESQASEIKSLKTQVQTQENRIKSAQESAIDLRKEATYETLEDDEIRRHLHYEIREKSRNWAKSWAITTSPVNSAVYRAEDLLQAMRQVADVNARNLRQQLEGIPVQVIVTALLSQCLCENIFEQPFYPLGPGSGLPEKLKSFYSALLRENESEAHAWRSSTLQLVNKTRTSGDSDLRKSTDASNANHTDGLAAKFLAGPVRYFLEPIKGSAIMERKSMLSELISASAEFSLSLWQQRVALEVRGFNDYENRPFDHKSEAMEPHRCLQLRENDNSRDGEKIKMVVQPGFFARGNEDGKRYDQEKVWAKAVVLLPKEIAR